ncbi:MAG: DNA recombination protein RmuC [Bacteroidota bacterium]
MEILGILGGFVVGAVVAWVIYRSSMMKSMELLNQRTEELNSDYEKKEQELKEKRDKTFELSNKVTELETENKNLQEQHVQNEKLLTEKFENLANSILDKKSQKFTDQNARNLGILLDPLREKIEKFEEKVEKSSKESLAWNSALKTQIESLKELNQQINKEAENLTKALKGETKTQGNWGEYILESILEKSGLEKDREYYVQESFVTEDGKRFQPDVIVKLPEDKQVIIDAKVSLVAYERFVNSEDEEEQKQQLSLHVQSVRKHIKDLGDKDYQKLLKADSLDFVLMFIPIEPAFSLAIQNDHEIFTDAYNKQIVIVSPSTLIATLRTIASIWKNEYQSRHSIEIARQSGNLYDKFVGFTNDLLKVGKSMESAKDTYDDAMNKLVTGKGNLIKKVEDIKKLGVKASKALDPRLVDRAGDYIEENLIDKEDEDNTGS